MKAIHRGFSSFLSALVAASCFFAMAASAEVTIGGLKPGGYLKLYLGTVDEFRWSSALDESTATVYGRQSISDLRDWSGKAKDACTLDLGRDPARNAALVQLTGKDAATGATRTLGFNGQKNWIGIREQSRGVDCGRFSPAQQVKLKLGTALSGLAVKHTELWINAKQNVTIDAVATAKGANPVYLRLETGLSAITPEGENVIAGNTVIVAHCKAGVSDSSPDVSADCKWGFDGNYDEITFTTGGVGEWSFAGGSTPSTFELVEFDGILDCSTSKFTGYVGDGITAPGVQGYRLNNTDGSTCVAIPYTLETSCEVVEGKRVCHADFRYDGFGQDADLAFWFNFVWPLESFPASIDEVPLTTVIFSTGAQTTLDVCPGTTATYSSGLLVSLTGLTAANDVDLGTDGIQAVCLTGRTFQQLPDPDSTPTSPLPDKAAIGEDIYIQGDIFLGRG